MPVYTHAHVHSHTRAHKHTHVQTCTALTHLHTITCVHARTRTNHVHVRTCTHACHVCTQTCPHVHTHPCTYAICTHRHTCIHLCTHPQSHTGTNTHTHTHTHTYESLGNFTVLLFFKSLQERGDSRAAAWDIKRTTSLHLPRRLGRAQSTLGPVPRTQSPQLPLLGLSLSPAIWRQAMFSAQATCGSSKSEC